MEYDTNKITTLIELHGYICLYLGPYVRHILHLMVILHLDLAVQSVMYGL